MPRSHHCLDQATHAPTRPRGPRSNRPLLTMIMTFLFAAGVAGALRVIPQLIAPRRLTPLKSAPFECGKDPLEIAEGRFAIKFSTIAIFFILIDIELLFIWPWAMLYRRLGWFGF